MSQPYDKVKLARRDNWFINKVCCIPNQKLDATTKLVVLGMSQQFVERGVNHTQMMKLWYEGIQAYCGLSDDSVGKSTRKLEKVSAVIKELRPEKNQQGIKVNRVWLGFTPEFLTDPASLFVDAETSNHGGKRVKRHKGCGCHPKEIQAWVCEKTGEVIFENDVEDEQVGAPEELARLDQQIEGYEATATLADMPRDELTSQEEKDTFKRAMTIAKNTSNTWEAF